MVSGKCRMPFDLTPRAVGSHRTWDESYVGTCVDFLLPHIKWVMVKNLTDVVLNTQVPERGGIYIFVRRSRLDQLLPFDRYPQVVYIGRAKNLRSRLNDYLLDKRSIGFGTKRKRVVRPAIATMFKSYKDDLDIYFFECVESKQVVYEDVLIKLIDPIFNEAQKYSLEIPEAAEYIIGKFEDKAELVDSQEFFENAAQTMTASFSDAEPAF